MSSREHGSVFWMNSTINLNMNGWEENFRGSRQTRSFNFSLLFSKKKPSRTNDHSSNLQTMLLTRGASWRGSGKTNFSRFPILAAGTSPAKGAKPHTNGGPPQRARRFYLSPSISELKDAVPKSFVKSHTQIAWPRLAHQSSEGLNLSRLVMGRNVTKKLGCGAPGRRIVLQRSSFAFRRWDLRFGFGCDYLWRSGRPVRSYNFSLSSL